MSIKSMLFPGKGNPHERNPRYARLFGEIESYEPQLLARINENNADDKQWAIQSKELMKKARLYLNQNRIDEAWKAFHTAKRMEIFGMKSDELIDVAGELRKEVAKLNEWRRDAIFELIGKTKAEAPASISQATLVRAEELKDDYYNNQYYKNGLTRKSFTLLFILLFLVITGIIIFFFVSEDSLGTKDGAASSMGLAQYLVGVILFGILGATTSSILFMREQSESTRISELGSYNMITLSKIFVGAGFTVFIFLLLRSSIAESIKLFNFSLDSSLDFFAIAFVSGFSERLAQRAIEVIAGKVASSKPQPQQASN